MRGMVVLGSPRTVLCRRAFREGDDVYLGEGGHARAPSGPKPFPPENNILYKTIAQIQGLCMRLYRHLGIQPHLHRPKVGKLTFCPGNLTAGTLDNGEASFQPLDRKPRRHAALLRSFDVYGDEDSF